MCCKVPKTLIVTDIVSRKPEASGKYLKNAARISSYFFDCKIVWKLQIILNRFGYGDCNSSQRPPYHVGRNCSKVDQFCLPRSHHLCQKMLKCCSWTRGYTIVAFCKTFRNRYICENSFGLLFGKSIIIMTLSPPPKPVILANVSCGPCG